jgi:hypothetical protein
VPIKAARLHAAFRSWCNYGLLWKDMPVVERNV